MSKVIIECKTNGDAFNLISELIYTINEAKHQAFRDYVEAMDRREFDKAEFYSNEYKKLIALGKKIRNLARVEL